MLRLKGIAREHARAMVGASVFFDRPWYLARNPDIALAGVDPVLHYLSHGAWEGRDPGPCFSTRGYIAANPDVGKSGMNPLLHFIMYGAVEGRSIGPNAGLAAFLATRSPLSLSASRSPSVSIVVVLEHDVHRNYGCLRAIEAATRRRDDIEVQVVCSASTDTNEALMSRVSGNAVTVLVGHDQSPLSLNSVARGCKADYLVVLDRSAEMKPEALDYAIDTIEQSADVAAVAARIVGPDGLLREAGGILWSDGTTSAYGRGDSPVDGEYMFRRDVAVTSVAFLMVRRPVFLDVGGFDERRATFSCQDVDLSLRLRQRGHRIVYDPRIEIGQDDLGGQTHESVLTVAGDIGDSCVKDHRVFFAACASRGTTGALSARELNANSKILFLDDHVPYAELGVGYPRARNLLRDLVELGYFVTFVPLESPTDDWENVRRAVPLEVEVMLGIPPSRLPAFLSTRSGFYDVLLVSRPNNMRTLISAVRSSPAWREIPVLYDAEAIWSLREALRRDVMGSPLEASEQERSLEEEMDLARSASHVTAVSERDAAMFRARGCRSVSVVGQGFRVSPTSTPYTERKDLLFVGALDEDLSPNSDALTWFAHEVLPRIREALPPPFHLMVAGRSAARRVRALESPEIVLLGQLSDLTPLYSDARLFVAPHRFAGGIPTKILEAAAHGLPCVSSDLVARQLGWHHGVELLSARTAAEFAQCVIQLYGDECLWTNIRTCALEAVERDHSERGFRNALSTSLQEVSRPMERS